MRNFIFLMLATFTVLAQPTLEQYYINGCEDGGGCYSIVGEDDQSVNLRFANIDPIPAGHNWWTYARTELVLLVQDRTIEWQTLWIDDLGNRYGIMTLDGNDIAELLLARGGAYIDHGITDTVLLDRYETARFTAVCQNVGVWGSPKTEMLPVVYRTIIDPAGQGRFVCPISSEPECEAFSNFEQAQLYLLCAHADIKLALDPDQNGLPVNLAVLKGDCHETTYRIA